MNYKEYIKRDRFCRLLSLWGIVLILLSPIFLLFNFIATILIIIFGLIMILRGINRWKKNIHDMQVNNLALHDRKNGSIQERKKLLMRLYSFTGYSLCIGFFIVTVNTFILFDVFIDFFIYLGFYGSILYYLVFDGLFITIAILLYAKSYKSGLFIGLGAGIAHFSLFFISSSNLSFYLEFIWVRFLLLGFDVFIGSIIGYIFYNDSTKDVESLQISNSTNSKTTIMKIHCPSCDSSINKEAKFCPKCGVKIKEKQK